jgi:chitodextrinase
MFKATKLFVTASILATVALVGQTAGAGKPERDKIDEMTAKMADAKASIKGDCGCDVAITAKWDTYKDASAMGGVASVLSSLKTVAHSHCQKPADKTAVCSGLTAVEVSFSGDKPSMVGKTLHAHNDNGTYNGVGDLGQVFDKF